MLNTVISYLKGVAVRKESNYLAPKLMVSCLPLFPIQSVIANNPYTSQIYDSIGQSGKIFATLIVNCKGIFYAYNPFAGE